MPSDGRSEGLAMLWREGKKVTFKSYSHSHINVVVCEEENGKNWRANRILWSPRCSDEV